MKRLILLVSVAVAWGTFSFADFPGSPIGGGGSGTTNASDLASGTLPAARIGDNSVAAAKLKADSGTPSATTFFRGDNTWATPSGLSDNAVTSAYILDNAIKNIDIASDAAIAASKIDLSAYATLAAPTFTGVPAAPTAAADTNTTQLATTAFVIGQGYAKLVSPSFTTPTLGAATATTLNTGQGAYELYAMDQNVRQADNVTFSTVTATEFVSSAADNTRGVTVPNTADPTTTNLAAGKGWFNTTTNLLKFRNGDNSATLSYYPFGTMTDTKTCIYTAGTGVVCNTTPTVYAAVNRTKTFSFAIDNVIATDNVLMWRVPVAVTLTRADCYATVDNVVGSLMECATDNVTSCTVLDAWTVTNAVSPFTDSSMTDGAVAAGAWIRWSTTSVGTASLNRLSCTIQYNE